MLFFPMNDFLIIYNPVSGQGKVEKIIKKTENLFKNKNYTIKQTKYKGHTRELCQTTENYKYIIIIGGDGTFNEAINGLMKNKSTSMPIIGFLPGGTGNSFMHDLKATSFIDAANIILSGQTKKIDILKLDFFNKIEYSLNIVGWGMVADINILSEKLRFIGSSRYTIASLYYVFNTYPRKAKIIIDGKEQISEFLFILNLNTIHTGKGMKAAPKALLDDGLMDIIILRPTITKFQLLNLLPKIYTGDHIHSQHIEYMQAKKIEIYPMRDEILNIDGEMKCKTPVSISLQPRKINIFST